MKDLWVMLKKMLAVFTKESVHNDYLASKEFLVTPVWMSLPKSEDWEHDIHLRCIILLFNEF